MSASVGLLEQGPEDAGAARRDSLHTGLKLVMVESEEALDG